jgi:hypothetical protein
MFSLLKGLYYVEQEVVIEPKKEDKKKVENKEESPI